MKNKILRKETVLLVHGLGGTRLDMWPISRRLKRRGFAPQLWGYLSLGHKIEDYVSRLIQDLQKIEEDPEVEDLHLVGHSLGSIILRAAVAQQHLNKLKRIVMLAPPNGGSHVARRLGPALKWLVPCLPQLSDEAHSYVNQLSQLEFIPDVQLGIVEAKKDRVIAKNCLRLNREHDYATVVGQHGILTWYSRTQALVENFLVNGRFESSGGLSSDESVAISTL